MTKIQVPIYKERDAVVSHVILRTLLGGFSAGLLVGVLSFHPFITSNIKQMIAGVGNVEITQMDNFPTELGGQNSQNETIQSDEVATEEQDEPEVLGADTEGATQPLPSSTDVSNTPAVSNVDVQEDREERIIRLGREIARIKDASVQLIAEFNQNCGVWTDECATPYAIQLEKNNTAYDTAAKELDALSHQ